jgi:hypothetical protein
MPSIMSEDKESLKSESITSKSRAYKLQFRHTNRFNMTSGKVQELVFWFKGDLKEATVRARQHCEVMNYTYIYCFPYIVDLEAREALKLKHEGSYEDEY